MDEKILVLLWMAVMPFLMKTSYGSNTYRGAVVEYNPSLLPNEEARVSENLENFKTYMKEAKSQGADIIVFPEYGLWIRSIYSPIPEPADHISPCDSDKFNTTKILKDLSCAAKKYAIYTVVNLLEKRVCKKDDKNCPPKGYYGYNSNVAFDRKGTVVARYSKFNLYDEPVAEKPKIPEISFFDTDFGVRFGIFTCFDIHFPIPGLKLVQQYQITDFISPFYWFSELPFLTALQVHRGWAESNNVNLLVSGLNYPTTATFGTGIYNGKSGHIVQIMPEKISRTLLVADVPKIKKSNGFEEIPENISTFSNITHMPLNVVETAAYEGTVNYLKDQIHLFTSEIIKSGQIFQRTVCSNENFCCNFRMIYDELLPESKKYTFRALSFNGVRKFGMSFRAGVQSCGVVLCEGLDVNNCTNRIKKVSGLFRVRDIQVKGDFKPKNSLQVPSTLIEGQQQLEPMSADGYRFIKVENDKSTVVSMELKSPVTNLQTFGIWGRDFTKDA